MTQETKKGFFSRIFGSKNQVNNEVRTAPENLPMATINVKDYGTIKAELYPHIAPNTVNNFIHLANIGFYDGLIFHRVIKNFVLQGGCPEGSGMGGPGYSIHGEFEKNKFKNDLKHTEGVLSMARSQAKNSGGSQFFVVTHIAPHLDKNYAGFGKVIEGIEIVKAIENIKTAIGDKPIIDIVIESIKVDTRGIKYPAPIKK
ncbi:MAG: peptidylprolyl isomerase [Romboutsia sp.]